MTTSVHTGRGNAKLILFGEHAVVYGVSALVAGLDRGATATARFDEDGGLTLRDADGAILRETSTHADTTLSRAFDAMRDRLVASGTSVRVEATVDVPLGAGLGSSAAVSAAASRALASLVGADDEAVDDAVSAAETIFHGNPSGIDQAAALEGGVFQFRRDDGAPHIERLDVETLEVVVCQPQEGASTAEMVEDVAGLHRRHPALCDELDRWVGGIVAEARAALERKDVSTLGELMNLNHGALVAMGVSTPLLDEACHAARDVGAAGAKLTGAGGGGCVYAVAEEPDDVLAEWDRRGWPAFRAELRS